MPVADIVQCGLRGRNVLRRNYLVRHASLSNRKLLILLVLLVWLAALDSNYRCVSTSAPPMNR